jgi:hypothetical protein
MSAEWRITGEQYAGCNNNYNWGCTCQFNARPTHGHREEHHARIVLPEGLESRL